jgi:hypothetical protein
LVTALRIVTVIVCLLVFPAAFLLVGTARGYLDTTADITALRIEVMEIRPINDPARALAGPEIVLRVYGVEQTSLRFAEVNFDLFWQGQRVLTVANFPNVPIPRNSSLSVTVASSLDSARATETKALIAAGERGFTIEGNARIGLPNSDASVWLTLRGRIGAAGAGGRGPWTVDRGPWVPGAQSSIAGAADA